MDYALRKACGDALFEAEKLSRNSGTPMRSDVDSRCTAIQRAAAWIYAAAHLPDESVNSGLPSSDSVG